MIIGKFQFKTLASVLIKFGVLGEIPDGITLTAYGKYVVFWTNWWVA